LVSALPAAPRRQCEAQWTAREAFADRLATDIELWAPLTKEAGIERQ
jgi:hypothetical protein